MHAQRVQTNSLAIFVVAGAGCKLVVRTEILRVVHRVVCDKPGGRLGTDDVT